MRAHRVSLWCPVKKTGLKTAPDVLGCRRLSGQGLVMNMANPCRFLGKQEWYHARSKKIRCSKRYGFQRETP